MNASDDPSADPRKRPGQTKAGARGAQERADRQAKQLRANLAKRKQQQRKRDAGSGEGGGV
ncbi:MAG TPA: hypothetical protein DCG48_06260 [Rhodospirillaceae bacterium]|nr:hypothetical protein [Rhodospirillaceae bacterium]|tara:strand:- start:852 stop:1034 length:183 start_codon:yes stop_codon:yes gene_type:complete